MFILYLFVIIVCSEVTVGNSIEERILKVGHNLSNYRQTCNTDKACMDSNQICIEWHCICDTNYKFNNKTQNCEHFNCKSDNECRIGSDYLWVYCNTTTGECLQELGNGSEIQLTLMASTSSTTNSYDDQDDVKQRHIHIIWLSVVVAMCLFVIVVAFCKIVFKYTKIKMLCIQFKCNSTCV